MKSIFYLIAAVLIICTSACNPQKDSVGEIGQAPSNAVITVDNSDPFNPVFTISAENGFIFHWDMGNNQTAEGKEVSSYYPFAGDYEISCNVAGAGGKSVTASVTYNVPTNDPEVANLPVWKELTGGGEGATWVYNTDPETGTPDFCYQTDGDIEGYPDAWKPSESWGQCEQITADINGEMVFDLQGGINYTYHHEAGDEGVKGTFILNTTDMTLTVVDPYILDHDVECTNPDITVNGVYRIALITEDQLILWQDQEDEDATGWAWSFKRKGTNPVNP